MHLRLIEVFLPAEERNRLQEILKDYDILGSWQEGSSEGKLLAKLLLPTEKTGEVLDLLEKHFTTVEGFRIVLLPVEASIPREQAEDEKVEEAEPASEKKPGKKIAGISREELYTDVQEISKLSWVFIVFVLLASVVAAIGILRDSTVAIIGAMVIAPLLGPNVALSLATTLGDTDLARRAMKTNLAGMLAALFLAFLVGIAFQVDPDAPKIVSGTKVGWGDIILALAAGSAAALSFTTGALSALIGVMVAVALLPPLVTLGMLIGAGRWDMALGAMLLLLTNLICVNLAGVVTFLARGIRPLTWWEANRAKKATRQAIAVWTFLLIILGVVILLSQRG
ncbi:MAG: TIGR00341 family protein [Candidatus Zixiibacteriota bacterium]